MSSTGSRAALARDLPLAAVRTLISDDRLIDTGAGMRFGVVLPIQDTQEPLDVLLDQLRAEVRAADEAGFDAFFLPEFHQTRAGGVISPLLTGAALAEGTRRIRVGQAVVPGPLYHPVRLAEDVAMLSW